MSTHGDPHLEMGTHRAHRFTPDRGTENAFTERETRNPKRRQRHDRYPYRRDRNSRPTQHGVSSSLSGATSVSEAGDPTSPPTIEPNSSQSTFQKTGVANIHGGLFMNIQNNFHPEPRSTLEHREVVPATVTTESEVDDNNFSTSAGRSGRYNNGELAIRTDYDIYYHRLLVKRRGSPMWIPGPDMNLPTEYRKEGINIGDVGILYRAEGFSFLFNIFHPADHPINIGRVPVGFEPFDLANLHHEVKKQVVFGPKSYIASGSKGISSKINSSGYLFETSASEGAILVIPNGAITVDLLSHQDIKAYVAKHAKLWYEFVTRVRQREVENGEIRLVMGFDKASTWGIATFGNGVEEQVRLQFERSADLDNTQYYLWSYASSGTGRAGPYEEELQDLRSPTGTSELRNQCMFVRTMNFSLSGKIWDDSTIHKVRPSDYFSDSRPPSNHRPSGPSAGGSGSSKAGKSWHSGHGNGNLHARQFGLSAMHPSDMINKLLLEEHPIAQIAITEDADWMSVITDDDVELPGVEELYCRLLGSREICCKDGVVSFKVAEGLIALGHSEPQNILESVSSSRHLWIPGLIEVDDDLMDWDHLNWEEESLSTEYHPKDRVLLEYGTSGMKASVDGPSKGISLETSSEREQVHRASTIYEGQWWQISSTPALPLEDAQPVWLSDSSQTRDMGQTSVDTSFLYDNDMDAWPIRPRPSPLPVLFQDCNRSRQTCDGHGPESPISNLIIDSQCVEASPTPGEDVRLRAGMSSMSRVNVGKSSRMNRKLMALRFQIPRLSRKKSGTGRGIGTPSDRGLPQRTIAPRAADIHMLPPDSSILVGLQCYHSPNLEK